MSMVHYQEMQTCSLLVSALDSAWASLEGERIKSRWSSIVATVLALHAAGHHPSRGPLW